MEIVIALFIGAWLSCAGILAYRQLKEDFRITTKDKEKNE